MLSQSQLQGDGGKSLNKSAEENVQKGPPAIAFRYLGKRR